MKVSECFIEISMYLYILRRKQALSKILSSSENHIRDRIFVFPVAAVPYEMSVGDRIHLKHFIAGANLCFNYLKNSHQLKVRLFYLLLLSMKMHAFLPHTCACFQFCQTYMTTDPFDILW